MFLLEEYCIIHFFFDNFTVALSWQTDILISYESHFLY